LTLIILSAHCRILDNSNVFLRQAVEFVNELVDLFVGDVNLSLDSRLVAGGFWRC
jgi:hypothetical protein